STFAFTPEIDAKKHVTGFETLDKHNLDRVIVFDVNPERGVARLFVLPQQDVYERSVAAWDARKRAGLRGRGQKNYAMWVRPDPMSASEGWKAAGSGISTVYPPIAEVPLSELPTPTGTDDKPETVAADDLLAIAADARRRIAAAAEVPEERVKIGVDATGN